MASDIVKESKENKKTEARGEIGEMVGNDTHGEVEWEEEAQNLEQMTIPTRNSHLPMGFGLDFCFLKSINLIF